MEILEPKAGLEPATLRLSLLRATRSTDWATPADILPRHFGEGGEPSWLLETRIPFAPRELIPLTWVEGSSLLENINQKQ